MDYFLAWWNLENLFDVEDSPQRPQWLQRKLASELRGWNRTVLDRKIAQLATVINQMNAGAGPDILGVCEIENRAVLDLLTAAMDRSDRRYRVVHADTDDARGIDVAFVYDERRFKKPLRRETFNHVVLKRNATRDIVQASFRTRTTPSHDLVLIGNHWPARLGGNLESEPYRILAAETLSYWLERIGDHLGDDTPVVVMGDFNDEPFNRSMTDYALALKDSRRVRSTRSTKPYLFNLMWPLQRDGLGTHYYDSWGMLDQIMVNRPLLRSDGALQLIANSCQIFSTGAMFRSGRPRRFNRPAARGGVDEQGFSDHLPVVVRLGTAT